MAWEQRVCPLRGDSEVGPGLVDDAGHAPTLIGFEETTKPGAAEAALGAVGAECVFALSEFEAARTVALGEPLVALPQHTARHRFQVGGAFVCIGENRCSLFVCLRFASGEC